VRIRGLVALLILVALLGGGAYFARRRLQAADSQASAPQYATAQVVQGPLVADVLGFGSLQPQDLAPLSAPTSGTVEQVFVQQGDQVDKVKLQKDLESLAAALGVPADQALQASQDVASIPVTAPQTGRVVQWSVNVGDSVQQGGALAQIVDDSHVVIQAGLVPYDYQHAAVGDAVTVHFDQFAGNGVPGTITALSPNPTPNSAGYFEYPVTITLVNPGLLQPRMQGEVTIHTPSGDYPLPQPVTITGYGKSTVVVSPVTGTVETEAVPTDGWVQQGQVLATLGGPNAITAVAQARAQVDQDQTTLEQDQQTETELTVISQLNGTVGNWFVQPGQRVGQGQALGMVFNSQAMNLSIQVSELQVANVQAGQPVIVTVPGLPGKTFSGKVTAVNEMGTSQNGLATFGVNISVQATSGLRPGMTADARIVIQTVQNAILVPVEAVIQQNNRAEVEVLQDGRPVAVPVTVGLVNDQYAQITSGLQVGQTVITGMAGPVPPVTATGGATSAGAAPAVVRQAEPAGTRTAAAAAPGKG
jgi:HlyD family secretion protein